MRYFTVILLLFFISLPCYALSTETLQYALPQEARDILGSADPADVQSGFFRLFCKAKEMLRNGMRESVKSAFLMAAACMLLSMLQGYAKSAGAVLPARIGDLTGATVILSLALQQNGALLEHCRTAVANLDHFTKLLTGVFAAASAAAGRPVSAAATAGAALLFSDVIFRLSLKLFIPAITWYLLLNYGGILTENGALRQAASVGKWLVTTFFKVFLTSYFAYLSFTGLVTGAADAAAVKTAKSLSSTVPLVGSVIAGASESILAGASMLRAGVGLTGFLGAVAICLTPFLQGVCHLLVFRILSVFAASFAEEGSKAMLDTLSGAYSILTGMLAACCAVQFITIVIGMTVTGI